MLSISHFVTLLDFFLSLCCIHALLSLGQIREFDELPARQMGRLTVEHVSVQCWFTLAITASLLVNTFSIYSIHSLNLRWLVALIIGLPTLLCILKRQVEMLRQLRRRASLLYVVEKHSNVTYYNAETLCAEYSLSVFPVKTYERLCRDEPLSSLADLRRELARTQHYLQLDGELRDEASHLSCIGVKKRAPNA